MEQSILDEPEADTTTRRYEEARAAAHRAMSSVTLVPDRPAAEPTEPERLSYRGFKFGAAFFGWLIMISMLVLLSAVVGGAAIAGYYILGYTKTDLEDNAGTVAISAAAAVVVVITLAYYIGGYVAGRLARFDGMRQGFGVWMISLLLIVLASSAGAFLNSREDYAGRIDRPNVPLTDDTLLTGGLITAAALLMLPLLFALLGGRTGQRYHDKIDDLIA
ncbi:hypothetical protein OHA70_39480 [Kribbella sp. NBC_00382]|uniref:hypothetical protein n=1 Tax=Kribbella sp. NBC_00382 TaxID=2975967 RepID=UPI002E249248